MPSPKDLSQTSLSSFSKQLIQSGYVTLPQMQKTLIEYRQSGRPLIEVLQAITGRSLPPELLSQYKRHHLLNLKILHGVEFLELDAQPVDIKKIAQSIDSLIPLNICHRYCLLPLKILEHQPSTVVVAMVNPTHLEAQKKLKQILGAKGMNFKRMGITQEDYDKLIEQQQHVQSEARIKQQKRQQACEQTIVGVIDIEGGRPHLEKPDVANNLSVTPSRKSAPKETVTNSNTNVSQRLQNLEKLLTTLTQEFQQLKQELTPTQEIPSIEPPIYQEPEVSKHENQTDLSKETIVADSRSKSVVYEELTDPGEWDDFKHELEADKQTITFDFPISKELEADKQTIAAEFPIAEDSESSHRESNPFLNDPWS